MSSSPDRGPDEAAAPLPAGKVLGRYVILETVGAGAMGVVYAAYDPELGRKIALKVLRAGSAAVEALRPRLMREAQALAKLSHPNVTAILDVGGLGEDVFLAMEFVEGETLTHWLRAKERPASEILAVLRQAGEGLAAAHESGLVHRDFKPDNVLVGRDGRTRVTDFGLARGMADNVELAVPDASISPSNAATLTRTGAVIGTPAYMAPEIAAGVVANAQSDQFSFAVTLLEALLGRRPRSEEREDGIRALPRWLRPIVARGLSERPEDRYPSLRVMLRRLESGSPWTRRSALIFGVVAGSILIAGAGILRGSAPVCTGAADAWGDVWSTQDREAVRAGFAKSAVLREGPGFSVLDRALETYRAGWIAAHTEACRATRVHGVQSEALLDLRIRCLLDRRKEVAALVRTLRSVEGLGEAGSAVARLSSFEACANTRALGQALPPPAAQNEREAIERLDGIITELVARDHLGDGPGFKKLMSSIDEDAVPAYPPVQARLTLARARASEHLQRIPQALELHHRAAALALEAHDDGLAADAWNELARLEGAGRGDMRAAETYAAYARASILRLGGDDEREARRLYGLAFGYYLRARELERARDLWKRARELYERSRGPDYFEIARLDRTYGEAIFESGEVEEGLSVMRRASALEERLTGKTSPWYGLARSNEADALTRIGRFEEAEDAFAAARATLPNTSRGDDGWHRHRHAELLRRTGRWKEALEEDYRARAYYVGWFPEDAYANSWWQTGVALDLIALGRPTEAIDLLERAAVLRNASPAGEERGETLYALARALWDSKRDRRRAIEVAREAREGYRPFADKYGVWYRDSMNAIEAWLRARGVRDF